MSIINLRTYVLSRKVIFRGVKGTVRVPCFPSPQNPGYRATHHNPVIQVVQELVRLDQISSYTSVIQMGLSPVVLVDHKEI